MVTAALKCASDEKVYAMHASPDDAKHCILKTLNWFEAHDEYEWPDFSRWKFDFSQAMRLRRALVQDVFNALQKAGSIKIGVPGTPDSVTGTRRSRQPNSDGRYTETTTSTPTDIHPGGRHITARKRLCKREAEPDADALSEHSETHHSDDAFLLEVIGDLLRRSHISIAEHLDKRNAHSLADMLHDSLVEIWDAPQQEDSDNAELLRQKAETWARRRRSPPPQRETPLVSPSAPQGPPASAQKSLFGPPAATKPGAHNPGGWAPVNQWAATNSIG